MDIYKGKATQAMLDDLHFKVAQHLGDNLEDPKILAQAINFLKNNNVVADVIESSPMISLTESIQSIANQSKEEEVSVTDLLECLENNIGAI